MESGGHEDKGGDKPEQAMEDGSSSRYYECVFCKQGFTTAQALGGHMNIHRRERARNRQPPISTGSVEHMENYLRPALSRPSSSHRYSQALEAPGGYNMCLPPSFSSTRHPHPLHTDQPRRSFTNLSLQLGYREEEKKQYGEEEEVDLELRLGHDP